MLVVEIASYTILLRDFTVVLATLRSNIILYFMICVPYFYYFLLSLLLLFLFFIDVMHDL